MLSLSGPDQVHRLATRLHRLKTNPWTVYGIALGGVLVATLVRWSISGVVHDRIPFTTYYPAIMVATLVGGFWVGALTTIQSAFIAWWLFFVRAFVLTLNQAQATSLITFVFVSLLLVGTVTALNSAIDLLLAEIENRRKSQPSNSSQQWWKPRKMASSQSISTAQSPAGTKAQREFTAMKPMKCLVSR